MTAGFEDFGYLVTIHRSNERIDVRLFYNIRDKRFLYLIPAISSDNG